MKLAYSITGTTLSDALRRALLVGAEAAKRKTAQDKRETMRAEKPSKGAMARTPATRR